MDSKVLENSSPCNIPNIIPILEKYKILTQKVKDYIFFAKSYENIFSDDSPKNSNFKSFDSLSIEQFNFFMFKAGNYILEIIDYIEENKDAYFPYRGTIIFNEIIKILTDWKYMFENPDYILKTRKCINWIKRKESYDTL
jgi:hypothetical protein